MHAALATLLTLAALTQPAPTPPTRRPPTPRIGVGLGPGPVGEWIITSVVPLSPAHRAGLKPGDLILRVRGVDVAFDDPDAFTAAFEPSPVTMTVERPGNPRAKRFYAVVPKRPPR